MSRKNKSRLEFEIHCTNRHCEALAKASQLVPVLHRHSNLSWWENLLFTLKLTPSTFRLKALHLALFLLLFAFSSKAQIYPVQVMPVLVPPYSLNTSDYYNGTSERLAVVLTNTDLQKPVLNVRLRMYIEGQNARLQSRDGVYYPTIILDAGIPQRISLGDLAPYFNIDNLNFSGITRAMYAQNGKLPEGFYSFCFEVIEVNTGKVLSRKSCSMAYITLSDPPLLNLPLKGENIASRAVQNIIFQWTPRNLGSPNGAFNTEYEFTLKELWDTGIAPEAAFESTQPLYQVTVRPTTLLMGPAEPQLIPGKRYAWRVRAVSTSPTGEQADSYRNNGFSEIYWFTYQSDCKPPLAINSSVSGGRATINWTADPSNGGIPAGGYTLQYREKSLSGSKWYSVNTLENRAMLYDLKPGSTYEYRVGSSCVAGNIGIGIDQATYSDILTIEINGNPKDTATVNCGMISPEISITNRTPIQALNQGDLIMAGGFPVKLTKVTGGGSFSGEGYVTIPMLGQVNVKVRFSGIQVNTERQLFGGVIETTYDVKEEQIADTRKIAEDLTTLINEIANLIKKRNDFTDQYTGTAENKKAAETLGKDENVIYDALLKSPYLTDEEKTALKAEQTSIGDAYTGLSGDGCDGNTVTPKKGPNVDLLNLDDYSKCKEILARATKIKEYADKAKERETLNNEKEKQDLASSLIINVDTDAKISNEVTAFLTPAGQAIYLDRAKIKIYTCDPVTGVVKGFTLKNDIKYSYDAGLKKYTDLSGQAFPLIKTPENGAMEVLLLKKLNCEVKLYAVNITSPNTSGNIPALASAALRESFAIKCLDGYFREHGAEYVTTLEKLYTIIEYFDKCSAGNWAPYENGVVPYCFWKGSNTEQALYYSAFDIPYRAGIIDGAYGQVKGIIDLRNNLEKVVYAYAIGSVGCENLINNVDEYNVLISEINKMSEEKGIISYVEKAYKEYKAKGYEEHAKDCLESKKIIEETGATIDRLYEIANNDGKLLDIATTVAQKLGGYLSKISGNDEIARYEKGKLTADVLALFIGTEEASASKKLVEFQQYLMQRATAQEIERLGAKITEKLADDVAKGTVELVGRYDWALVKRYFNYIQEITGRPILAKQVEELKSALRLKEYTKLSSEEYIAHTKLFTKAKRKELIAKWEIETGQKWPTYTERYYDKNGEVYKEIGDEYDAHHIIEQNYGGNHEWWNMHPAKFPDEHQAGIHGANSPARQLFK
ncbi:hypothetical protein G6M26_06125 [Agrobacterium tumefaciens]|nr:hypothetical protein [Agrobacterium tumefaciens]NTE18093.1 hypothetical protein [Agrobacterium tumefaciens]